MNVHLNTSVFIFNEAKEKYLVMNLFANTYPLLEGKLIFRITFKPQGVDDSAIQPSHQYHGRNYSG